MTIREQYELAYRTARNVVYNGNRFYTTYVQICRDSGVSPNVWINAWISIGQRNKQNRVGMDYRYLRAYLGLSSNQAEMKGYFITGLKYDYEKRSPEFYYSIL